MRWYGYVCACFFNCMLWGVCFSMQEEISQQWKTAMANCASVSAWEIWISEILLCLKPGLSDPPKKPHTVILPANSKHQHPLNNWGGGGDGFKSFQVLGEKKQSKNCISPTTVPVSPPLISPESDRFSDASAPDLVPPLKTYSQQDPQFVSWCWR